MTKSRKINAPRFKWTAWHDAMILAMYAHSSNYALIKIFGCTTQQLYSRAYHLGAKKSTWFWKNHPTSGNLLHMPDEFRSAGRFIKGHNPHNKGRKGICFKGSEKGWFAPGTKPKNLLPVGTIRKIRREGYYEVKIQDTGIKTQDWIPIHRLVWERCNGKPVPKGYMIYYRDKNYENYEISNLGCITFAQNMQRNTVHNYGPEIFELTQLKAQITRQINRKGKQNEQCQNAV